jgi:hypothetical protein
MGGRLEAERMAQTRAALAQKLALVLVLVLALELEQAGPRFLQLLPKKTFVANLEEFPLLMARQGSAEELGGSAQEPTR